MAEVEGVSNRMESHPDKRSSLSRVGTSLDRLREPRGFIASGGSKIERDARGWSAGGNEPPRPSTHQSHSGSFPYVVFLGSFQRLCSNSNHDFVWMEIEHMSLNFHPFEVAVVVAERGLSSRLLRQNTIYVLYIIVFF